MSNGSDETEYASLEVIRAELDLRLTEQDRRGAAFDNRAGIVVGFSGALIGLSAPASNWVNLAAMSVAVVAAFAAARSMWPRLGGAIDPRIMRNTYLTTEPRETRLRLLDTRILLFEQDQARLELKGKWVKWSAQVLAVAILVAGAGAMVDFFGSDDKETGGIDGPRVHHRHESPSGPAYGPGPEHHG